MAKPSKRPGRPPQQPQGRSRSIAGVLSVSIGIIALGLFWRFLKPDAPVVSEAGLATPDPASNQLVSIEPPPPELTSAEQEQALHRETLDAVESLLNELPENDDAAYLAGLVHNDMGDTMAAVDYWRKSVELDPSRVDGWDSLGKALLEDDQYETAEEHFRRALEIDSTQPEPRFHLAKALSNQGKLEDVVKLLDGAPQLSIDGWQLLGETYQELGDLERAKAAFESVLARQSDFMSAHYALSQVWARLGDPDKANAHRRQFSLLKQQSDERARRKRDEFSPLANATSIACQAYTDIGRVYASQQQLDKAEAAWQRARVLDPENTFCRVQLAALFRQTGRRAEALTIYEELAAIDTEDPLIQLNLGYLAVALSRIGPAEAAFREVIRLAPERPEGHTALCQLYLQTRRNPQEAVELAERAAALSPTAENHVTLARAHAANRNSAAAVAAVDQAIRLEPDNSAYFKLRETFQSGQP